MRLRHERFPQKSKPCSTEGRPYYKGNGSMPWFDRLPFAWRELVNEYQSLNGIKSAIRRGLTPEEARASLEEQRQEAQWQPVLTREEERQRDDVMKQRERKGQRILASLNQWLEEHPPEKRRKRGAVVAGIIALIPFAKALAAVVR